MTTLWGRIRGASFSWLILTVFFVALDVVDGFPLSWSVFISLVLALWPGYFALRWYLRGY